MPILIVEGGDLAGKTTAIEKIAKHFNSGFVLKNSFKPRSIEQSKDIYAQYWRLASLIVSLPDDYLANNLIILDRFFPSQAVYSFLRGEDEMNHTEIMQLDRYFHQWGAKLLMLNIGKEDLLFIEVQTGSYFGEDDIERFEDDFGRV